MSYDSIPPFKYAYHFSDPTATLLAEWPGGELGARGFGALNKRCDIKIFFMLNSHSLNKKCDIINCENQLTKLTPTGLSKSAKFSLRENLTRC